MLKRRFERRKYRTFHPLLIVGLLIFVMYIFIMLKRIAGR